MNLSNLNALVNNKKLEFINSLQRDAVSNDELMQSTAAMCVLDPQFMVKFAEKASILISGEKLSTTLTIVLMINDVNKFIDKLDVTNYEYQEIINKCDRWFPNYKLDTSKLQIVDNIPAVLLLKDSPSASPETIIKYIEGIST